MKCFAVLIKKRTNPEKNTRQNQLCIVLGQTHTRVSNFFFLYINNPDLWQTNPNAYKQKNVNDLRINSRFPAASLGLK